jgi:hypothetical protein
MFIETVQERMREGMHENDFLFETAHANHAAATRGPSDTMMALARGGRTVREWLTDLRTVREAHYRVAAIHDEDLLRVLSDPKADESVRAAAAICLAKNDGEKVRIAADDVAEPKLRAAIDAALDDDEAKLEQALAAI